MFDTNKVPNDIKMTARRRRRERCRVQWIVDINCKQFMENYIQFNANFRHHWIELKMKRWRMSWIKRACNEMRIKCEDIREHCRHCRHCLHGNYTLDTNTPSHLPESRKQRLDSTRHRLHQTTEMVLNSWWVDKYFISNISMNCCQVQLCFRGTQFLRPVSTSCGRVQ